MKLGNLGRIQTSGDNVIRHTIRDKKGIMFIINIIDGKLITPKNIRVNDLIKCMNSKYNLDTMFFR